MFFHRHDYHTGFHLSTTVDDYTYTFDANNRSLDYGKVHIHKMSTADRVNQKNWTQTTTNLYQNGTIGYIKGLKIRSTVVLDSDGVNSAEEVTKIRDYRYDELGRLDRVIIEPDLAQQNSPEYLWTKYEYDTYGNVKKETTRGNSSQYQSLPDRVTTTTTSYPLAGQNSVTGDALVEPVMRQVIINPENQSTSVETDLDHGLPLVMSDVNGLFTRYEYDEYGRKPKITSPDKSYTQVSEHDWVKNDSKAPTTAQYYKKTVFESTSASESQQTPLTEYFDEHGNLLRTYQHRWHTDSKAVIVDYTYDRLGRLTHGSTPYYEGQGYLNTVRSYVDNTQYLLKLSDYRGPTQDYEYDRYTVTRTDSDGHVHREERNAKNQNTLKGSRLDKVYIVCNYREMVRLTKSRV